MPINSKAQNRAEKFSKKRKKAERKRQRASLTDRIKEIPPEKLLKAINITKQRIRINKLSVPENKEISDDLTSQRGYLMSLGRYFYHNRFNIPDYKTIR